MRASLHAVLETRRAHAMAFQKYDVRMGNGSAFEERYWSPLNTPLLDGDRVVAIIHRVDDVTRVVMLERAAEKRTRELEEKNRLLSEATERLSRLAADRLAPVLLVAPRVLAVPIVGALDEHHAGNITDRLLRAIRREHPVAVVLDLSAATGFDAALAARLLQATQAARLLGTRVMLTGLTVQAAESLAGLAVDFSGIETYAALADAIAATAPRTRARAPRARTFAR